MASEDDYADIDDECAYYGTDHIDVKIWLIGVFATSLAVLSIIFNSFFTLVFIRHPSLRKTAVFYFGIIAVIDILMAFNYIAIMSIPVYFDYYSSLPMYHLFLWYVSFGMAESSAAIFASMLLIVLATAERLLGTCRGDRMKGIRRFVESHRPLMCVLVVVIAVAYKVCIFWEIEIQDKPQCDNFSRYEVVASWLARIPEYSWWWMFVTRTVVDRVAPFFILVATNYVIVKMLKRDMARQADFDSKAALRGTDPDRDQKRGNVRDATRALISIVSMYIMSQSLQIVLTVFETFSRETLENNVEVYSYLNDTVSILILLSSCLRFPVYCSCNRVIHAASADTFHHLVALCCGSKEKYQNINKPFTGVACESSPVLSRLDEQPCKQSVVSLENNNHARITIARIEDCDDLDSIKEWEL